MRVLAILSLSLWLAAPWATARADEAPSSLPVSDQTAIHGVIQKQLDAFLADDAGAAFGYASPAIQGLFGDPTHFMAMVRNGYQQVYRPRRAVFGPLVELDGHTVQKLHLIGPDGSAALALYYMEREPDGSWRIDGCQLLQQDEVGA